MLTKLYGKSNLFFESFIWRATFYLFDVMKQQSKIQGYPGLVLEDDPDIEVTYPEETSEVPQYGAP